MTKRIVGLSAVLAATALLAAPATQARTVATATCKGNDKRCTATLNLHGGQSGTRVIINLLGTDMELRAVHAIPSEDQGAFALSHGHFKLGGSQYVARLDAVDGIGKFQLRFLFKAP